MTKAMVSKALWLGVTLLGTSVLAEENVLKRFGNRVRIHASVSGEIQAQGRIVADMRGGDSQIRLSAAKKYFILKTGYQLCDGHINPHSSNCFEQVLSDAKQEKANFKGLCEVMKSEAWSHGILPAQKAYDKRKYAQCIEAAGKAEDKRSEAEAVVSSDSRTGESAASQAKEKAKKAYVDAAQELEREYLASGAPTDGTPSPPHQLDTGRNKSPSFGNR